MNKKSFPLSLSLWLLLAVFGFSNCSSKENLPTEKEVFEILRHHFSQEHYKGYVELLSNKIVFIGQEEYMDGKYLDVDVEARILVKKGHVVSKLFTMASFEVNEEWAESYELALARAADEQERENLIELFELNSFSQGEHPIKGTLGFAWYEGRWHLLSMTLLPHFPDEMK